jgi:ribonuclease BN (tRNA processing enzyme)
MDFTSNERSKTQIVLLGTGTPNADPERSGPSVAIVVNDTPYLVDCGPGVVRRAAAAHQAGVQGLNVENLRYLFLTHLHSDHTVGYPDLIFTPWVLGRNEPLAVFGPEGTQSMTDHILAAYGQDIIIRRDGLEPANNGGCAVNVREIIPGICYQDHHVTVEAFLVKHGDWPAFGYKFTTPDKVIVLSGDTRPIDTVLEHSTGCDVLIHEVYSAERWKTRPKQWRKYHKNMHTSTTELAAIASQTQPDLLILYHQLFWGATEEDLLAEIQQGYNGKVISGNDLDVFVLISDDEI